MGRGEGRQEDQDEEGVNEREGERRNADSDGETMEKKRTEKHQGPGSILHTVSTGQQGHRAKKLQTLSFIHNGSL